MKFHHVGCACKDIEKTAKKLSIQLSANASEVVYDANQDAELCMLQLPDGSQIELVSGKVVENIVSNRQSYYHVCYAVKDIKSSISDLQSKGMILISPPKEAVLFNNNLVAFLHSAVGLVELVEDASF
ncbi:VOC family protein [Vibrio sp. Hep-1b-8]|uniref:VOC family protein n=1 Tax=Vibrio sp. Hep-1b-8 TaxID=2144187 RepID=UPI00111031AB|nr:VOC family protein [Vibrio sp. Hep-1b-8]TMX34365.1 lactoylglutathione lyase [Vibrio sp. Hep-1b-8]